MIIKIEEIAVKTTQNETQNIRKKRYFFKKTSLRLGASDSHL
jgi:hypothetical protein